VVLGNHDLHLLALARSQADKRKQGDTLDEIFSAADRELLLDWLQSRPLLHYDDALGIALVHAGLPPQWNIDQAVAIAREVSVALSTDAHGVYAHMYGDRPDQWSDALAGYDRLRFAINCFTRLRYCTANGRINLRIKGVPGETNLPWMPWFKVPGRASAGTRIVCGHWSALGLHLDDNVIALDTGCVWGGRLTALRLDAQGTAIAVDCRTHRTAGNGKGGNGA
jgi:bis(5'-nucleosyl)-tetraphosphatase (symmetrical)